MEAGGIVGVLEAVLASPVAASGNQWRARCVGRKGVLSSDSYDAFAESE